MNAVPAGLVTLAALTILAGPLPAQIIESISDDALPRSERLVILGSGFGPDQGDGRVEIGGHRAPISFWSDDKIKAYVPEDAEIGAAAVRVFAPEPSNALALEVQARAPGPDRVRWRFRADDSMLRAQPAVGPDGTIYVTGLYGHMYAVSADGGLRWIVQANGASAPDVGPDGTIYVSGLGGVNAFNPDGTRRWTTRVDGTHFGGPNVGPDGNIYGVTGGYTGDETGAYVLTPAGEMLFNFPGPNFRTSPAAWEVAFGGDDKWYATSGMGWPTVGIIGLMSFDLGGGHNWLRNGLGQVRAAPSGHVYVNNPQDDSITSYDPDGNVRWHVALNDLPGRAPSPPGLGPDETFYVPQNSPQWFNAIASDGTVRWSVQPHYKVAWPIVHPDNTMVIAGGYAPTYGESHVVQAIAPATGERLWTVELPWADESWKVAQQWYGEFSRNARTVYVPTSGTEAREPFSFLYAIDTTGGAGDVDGDGLVDLADVLRVLASWGPCSGACPADLDDDGQVGLADLLIVLANWS